MVGVGPVIDFAVGSQSFKLCHYMEHKDERSLVVPFDYFNLLLKHFYQTRGFPKKIGNLSVQLTQSLPNFIGMEAWGPMNQ